MRFWLRCKREYIYTYIYIYIYLHETVSKDPQIDQFKQHLMRKCLGARVRMYVCSSPKTILRSNQR